MNWSALEVGRLAALSDQTYSVSADSLVLLLGLLGALCFGPVLLRNTFLRRDLVHSFVMLRQLCAVGSSRRVSFGHTLAKGGWCSHTLFGIQRLWLSAG